MATIKIDRLEDVQAGDVVTLTATNGTTLKGKVDFSDGKPAIAIDGNWVPVFNFETDDHSHWSAERVVPDLPTEPGFYLDSTGDCWELQSDGQWFPFGGWGSVPQLAIVETYAPFTRLVREGAEAVRTS